MNAKLKFDNGTVRPRFKLISEIDEDSITIGYVDSAKPRVVRDDDAVDSANHEKKQTN